MHSDSILIVDVSLYNVSGHFYIDIAYLLLILSQFDIVRLILLILGIIGFQWHPRF